MSLTPCRECGKSISSEAVACPHCGCPSVANAPSVKCIRCGAVISSSKRFCTGCGLCLVESDGRGCLGTPPSAKAFAEATVTRRRAENWGRSPGGLFSAVLVGLSFVPLFFLALFIIQASSSEHGGNPEIGIVLMISFLLPFSAGIIVGLLAKYHAENKANKYEDDALHMKGHKDSDAASYCPKCNNSYLPGIAKCADCGVDLVKYQ